MYQFKVPDKIMMGDNIVASVENIFNLYGKHALIVTGPNIARSTMIASLERTLDNDRVKYNVITNIEGEPTVSMIEAGVKAYHEYGCDFIIGLGGGSPLDSAKAIAAMTVLEGSIADYKGIRIDDVELPPVICIPTTAGSGSEVTQYTIITEENTGVKMLLRGNSLLPKVAMLDYTFANGCPKTVTASAGLDALTHAIEAFISVNAQPLSDALALSAIKRIMRYLPQAYRDGSNFNARREMAIASLQAGICINNSSVTLIHGMSRPIGARFHVPHGMSNAMLLNVCLSDMEMAARHNLSRIATYLRIQAVDEIDASEKFVEEVEKLVERLEVPTMSEFGIDRDEYMAAVDDMSFEAIMSGSPSHAPREYTADVIRDIYIRAYK
ncbi:MAG: iron-containing alcohol dehydrogenase [Muribaculaceae bacterium]|nr:iron-containing alcohol dehydrogenase [Muribaculaceae bacterium]